NSADFGGGIYNNGANATVNNSTVSGNNSSSGAGGIVNFGINGSGMLEIANTVLNAGTSGGNLENDAATVTSHGYNLSSDAAGGDATTGPGGMLDGPGDVRNTDPLLGPLQDNGGATMTHALLLYSPAIDAGDPS